MSHNVVVSSEAQRVILLQSQKVIYTGTKLLQPVFIVAFLWHLKSKANHVTSIHHFIPTVIIYLKYIHTYTSYIYIIYRERKREKQANRKTEIGCIICTMVNKTESTFLELIV